MLEIYDSKDSFEIESSKISPLYKQKITKKATFKISELSVSTSRSLSSSDSSIPVVKIEQKKKKKPKSKKSDAAISHPKSEKLARKIMKKSLTVA